MKSFATLALREALLKNLEKLEYHQMTPIQELSLPIILEGQDVIAEAKTGSGKTVAFGLTVLNSLNIDKYAVQALILCPTRELAEQVSQVLRQLARLMPNIKVINLSGGMPMHAQLNSLRHEAHIVVGTPGRVQKHLDKNTLNLNQLQTLVLDEADRMLDMGFYDAINDVIEFCPKTRQTLLFSATYPSEIKTLAHKFLKNPKRIIVKEEESAFDTQQIFYEVANSKVKFPLLKNILLHEKPESTLIFCNTKEQTVQLASMLCEAGFSASALNGDMEQFDRDTAFIRFKNKSCSILVATDVAARGLDVKELPLVINYELAFEHDIHIHRIGRTGRAGHKGFAVSLTTPLDAERLGIIAAALAEPLTWGNAAELKTSDKQILIPAMQTLLISAGKKDKIRPGDILGVLTKEVGLKGESIGKIDIFPAYSYVAVESKHVAMVLKHFTTGKLKNKKVNVKKLK
jgi:ATP-independent RNA helicase DbpA